MGLLRAPPDRPVVPASWPSLTINQLMRLAICRMEQGDMKKIFPGTPPERSRSGWHAGHGWPHRLSAHPDYAQRRSPTSPPRYSVASLPTAPAITRRCFRLPPPRTRTGEESLSVEAPIPHRRYRWEAARMLGFWWGSRGHRLRVSVARRRTLDRDLRLRGRPRLRSGPFVCSDCPHRSSGQRRLQRLESQILWIDDAPRR